MNMSNTEDSSLTPRTKLPPSSASRPLSSIPEFDDVKPSFSSRLPPRTLSGGFSHSFGNEGSASSKLTALSRTQSGGLDQYKTKVLGHTERCSVCDSTVASSARHSEIWIGFKLVFIGPGLIHRKLLYS